MKLLLLYRRRWWLIYLPLAVLLLATLAVTLLWWEPLPPQRVVIGTGPAQSSYLELAREYAVRLEKEGIAVDIVPFPRPQDPLAQLGTNRPNIDITFAQGLYADTNNNVQTLAVVGHEILWVVARDGIQSLSDLRNHRIAASVEGSSNRLAAQLLLQHARVPLSEVSFTDDVGEKAVVALADGRVDAVVHVATGNSRTVAALVRMVGFHLLPVDQVGALVAKAPQLRAVIMPQGSIELRSNLPSTDLPCAVTLTHLVARPGLHPALQRTLLDVADEIHVMAGFLERQGVYPTTVGSAFPVAPEALLHQQGTRPWLETLLPYGTAQWAQLILFVVLPLGLVGSVLLIRAPRYIEWRVEAALLHFYGELQFLEDEFSHRRETSEETLGGFEQRVDALERLVTSLELPDHFTDRWYTLREHLDEVRLRIRAAADAAEVADPA